MHKLEINAHLFNRLFPEKSRREMERQVACALLWGDPERLPECNLEYFAHLGTYAGRAKDLPPAIKPLNDLFPPNIAVLDYLVRFVNPNEGTILDFACGLGGLVVQLRHLGFKAYGFDSWKQVSFRTAKTFVWWYAFASSDWLLSTLSESRGSSPITPTTLVFIGGHWEWITPEDKVTLFTPTLRRILVDSNYSPRAIEGFELTSYYQGLLHAFERCGE